MHKTSRCVVYALNNPLRYSDPDGEWIHILAGAIIGGLINGIAHADGNGGFWTGFAIGAVAGAVIAATGGAAAVYASTGTFASAFSAGAVATATAGASGGAIAGVVGAAIGDPIRGFGNQAFFDEPYSARQYSESIVWGGIIGGVSGGVSGYISNLKNPATPTNLWTGRTKAPGTSIWSFSNKPNFSNAKGGIEIGQITGQADELFGGNPYNYGSGSTADQGLDKIKYIGRLKDLSGLPRNLTLLDDLPDLGNPKANYYQNMSVLRKAIRDGYTIKDASWFRPNSALAPTLSNPNRTIGQTFLGAERLLLQNRKLWPH